MKVRQSYGGPFSEKPYFKTEEIERIAADELRSVDLLPSSPQPIRVERFIEKRFGSSHDYENLPSGVLGYTLFGPDGVEKIIVSRSLGEEGTVVAERRVNTTLAHEVGHGLLHAHLFVLDSFNRSLFNDDDASPGKVLCRDVPEERPSGQHRYHGRWWEVQANMLMGSFLLPKTLVAEAIEPFLEEKGKLGVSHLPMKQRETAARHLAGVFDVNPAVSRIRLEGLYPHEHDAQLTF